jgi:hypothetical protein
VETAAVPCLSPVVGIHDNDNGRHESIWVVSWEYPWKDEKESAMMLTLDDLGSAKLERALASKFQRSINISPEIMPSGNKIAIVLQKFFCCSL